MDPSLTSIPTPGAIKAISEPVSPPAPRLIPSGAIEDCAKFTSESFQIAFSPRFSAFLHGINMLSHPKSGGMFSGLDHAIGGLMVMASPAWLAIRLSVGIPGLVIGSISTVAAAIGTGVESVGRNISGKVKQMNAPSDAEIQQRQIIEAFVQRMHETLKNYSFMEQRFCKENPAQLIGVCLMIVAFRARKLEGKSLYVQEKIVKEEQFQDQDGIRKKYFKDLCELKDAIASLHLSPDDEYAWLYLVEALKEVATEEALNQAPSDEAETLRFVMEKANGLGVSIADDPIFKEIWQKSIA